MLRFQLYHQEMLVNINFRRERCLTRRRLLEKVTTMKKIEYPLLGKEIKAQTDIAKTQYQRLNKFFKSDEKEQPATIRKKNKSDLIYESKYSFYKYYRNCKKFDNLSFKPKYSFLA